MVSLYAVLALVTCVMGAQALNNGLSQKPILGYNTWNYFGCNINETVIRATADKMVELGLVEAGYTYLNIDDCWHLHQRSDSGQLQSDPEKFPSGMKALGEYIHSKGLKFGIYSDAGLFTCAGYPGSRGYEVEDAKLWASWDVDYLKYDNCFAASEDVIERYTAMRDALNATGKPIVYSLCDWGVADPWLWGPEVGNSWRTDNDIQPMWSDILRSIDNTAGLARFAGPGGWNDPDMLEIGNGALAITMQRAHFALWALVKSPLLIGTDLRLIMPTSLKILLSKEVININQDPLGVAGDLIWKQGPREVWAGPLQGGDRAVVLFNRHTAGPPAEVSVDWQWLGYPQGTRARVRDCFAEENLGTYVDTYSARLDNADVAILRVTPLHPSARYDSWRPWHGEGPILAQAAVRRASARKRAWSHATATHAHAPAVVRDSPHAAIGLAQGGPPDMGGKQGRTAST